MYVIVLFKTVMPLVSYGHSNPTIEGKTPGKEVELL